MLPDMFDDELVLLVVVIYSVLMLNLRLYWAIFWLTEYILNQIEVPATL